MPTKRADRPTVRRLQRYAREASVDTAGGVAVVARIGGNLPAEISSFVGRRDELAKIAELVSTNRLVTVTGVGGVGKTRTALRAAAAVREEFPDGVWLVELSGLMDTTLIAHTIADALGLQDQTLRSQVDVL